MALANFASRFQSALSFILTDLAATHHCRDFTPYKIGSQTKEIPLGAYGKPHKETWLDFLDSRAWHDYLQPFCRMPVSVDEDVELHDRLLAAGVLLKSW